ncbi:hypothetical protein [Caulobacter sp. SSI4214]|uniref:hypothetical protein n=1 Tax=Caulobacter sp. SSI4214 TaxID=2575739 RepID=UPI00143AFC22|nr:hypothetical protein [Caulobacter sp. SSI4214]
MTEYTHGGGGRDEDAAQFLDDPLVSEALGALLDEFARETDRGAILVAADIVSSHLALTISELAPFSAKRTKSLLGYPGLLASFSARLDMAYMAGFISKNVYDSADALRKLRNAAAHSQRAFKLADHRPRLWEIADLGPNIPATVNRFAAEALLKSYVDSLMASGPELEAQIGKNPFSTPAEAIALLRERPEFIDQLQDRLPRHELALAVWLLLGLMSHKRKRHPASKEQG